MAAAPLSAREQAMKTLAELATFPNYFPDHQLFLMIGVGWASLIACALWVRSGVLLKRPTAGRAARAVEHVVGALLAVFWVANVYYKAAMGWVYLAFLLYPCHTLSLAWLYVIWSRNHRRAEFVWNLLVFYTEFPLLALLFPDTSDVVFPLQTEVYWAQHVLLVTTPLILYFTKRYHIERVSHHWYFVAVLVGIWYCFGVQLLLAMVLRVNINYTLWPPPGHEHDASPLSGPLYHVKMALILMALMWLLGYPLFWLAAWVERRLAPAAHHHKAS